MTSERALVSFADGREEIVTSLALEQAGPDAAVVYPVPGDAEVSAVEGPDLFAYLERVTAPPPEDTARGGGDDEGAAGGAAPGGGVEVVGREEIGGYDVTRLRADDPDALQKFLDQEGYTLPAEAQPILSDYVDQGWRFVAVKLAEGSADAGSLKPLKIAFDSDEIVYPKRLDSIAEQPPFTKLFVVSDRRMQTTATAVRFAGEVDKLREPPPAEHRALFRGRYLTVLEQTAPLSEDFVVRPAATNAAFGSGAVSEASTPPLQPGASATTTTTTASPPGRC